MAAIITDQIRLLNAKNFIAGINTSNNAYYTFIGLPNPTDYSSNWNTTPPSPRDSFDQESDYWDTMVALKKVASSDVMRVIPKRTWASGSKYDMYRHDYSIDKTAPVSGSATLYSSFFYVMNSEFRVYSCLQNGTSPDNPTGKPSLDEPTFTDLEPRAAGSSGDGYIWKYLYTIKPSQAIKFDSTEYIPVPSDWYDTSSDNVSVRQNASTSGQLKIVTIRNRGVGLGTANITYTRVPIVGDGTGGEATVVVNNDSKVESVTVSSGGSGYTFGTLDIVSGGLPAGTTSPVFNIIVPPDGGHGYDIYRELGAFNVLTYARFENDTNNPDYITGNQFARIGLIENPESYDSSSILNIDKSSAVYALKLIGVGYSSANFTPDNYVTQTVSSGSTAVGRVVSYDQTTGVLKLWQDRTTAGFNSDGSLDSNPIYGFTAHRFTSNITTGGSINVLGGSVTLEIDTGFTGISTVINNRTYYLGQSFTSGVSQPEVKKYSGNTIYVDNRPSVTRSSSQKEDVKIILQF